jgi:hypothetical protein
MPRAAAAVTVATWRIYCTVCRRHDSCRLRHYTSSHPRLHFGQLVARNATPLRSESRPPNISTPLSWSRNPNFETSVLNLRNPLCSFTLLVPGCGGERMKDRSGVDFNCPNCAVQYNLVRAELGLETVPDKQIECCRCGEPFQSPRPLYSHILPSRRSKYSGPPRAWQMKDASARGFSS